MNEREVFHEVITDLERMEKTDVGALSEAFHKLMLQYSSLCRGEAVQGRGFKFHVKLILEVPEDRQKKGHDWRG